VITDRLIAWTAREEGEREDVYRDSKGYWTIGIGCLVHPDKTLTIEQARALAHAPWDKNKRYSECRKRLETAESQLRAAYPWFDGLPQLVHDGLVQMTYQLGIGNVGGFPTMLKCLKSGNWHGAEIAALDSDWYRRDTPARAARVAAALGNRGYPTEEAA